MRRLFFFVIILAIPVCSLAEYSIYLNNGSVISGVSSYDEAGEDVYVFFSAGTMTIPRKDVLKIEGSPGVEEGVATEAPQEAGREGSPEAGGPPASAIPGDDKNARVTALREEWNSVNTEIKAVEEQETRLVTQINGKTGERKVYNRIQMIQLERELEPLKQELRSVQEKKAELVRKRSTIETEYKSLE